MAAEDVETDMKENSDQDGEVVPGNIVELNAAPGTRHQVFIFTLRCK